MTDLRIDGDTLMFLFLLGLGLLGIGGRPLMYSL
jgi:hypothetical protein